MNIYNQEQVKHFKDFIIITLLLFGNFYIYFVDAAIILFEH